jgi:hypothetical protein
MNWRGRLFACKRVESDPAREFPFHFEMPLDQKMQSGIPESEVRRPNALRVWRHPPNNPENSLH